MTQATKPDYGDTLEAQLICDYVGDGETLVDACRILGVNYFTTFQRIRANPKFAEMMEAARESGFEIIANGVRLVTRGELGHSSGDPKRDKLIAEMDMKLLAKWHPKRYGEKIQIESKTASVAIPASDDPIEAQKAYEQFLKS